MARLTDVWTMYTPMERRNILVYVVGIMLYKFGLEVFTGSITTLAQERFTQENTYAKLGALTGLNQAMQCIGSILIAPLIKKFPTRSILASAILVFGLLTSILLIVDRSTGGKFKTAGTTHYGHYSPDALFPVYCATGIAYGMIELIRRVIPRDIVGGHVVKLKRMDAIVHFFYEVSGTGGAFASVALIGKLGNNYAFLVTPIFFAFAAICWTYVSDFDFYQRDGPEDGDIGEVDPKHGLGDYFSSVQRGFKNFAQAVYTGAAIVVTKRKFAWLIPGYSLAFYSHRYLESNLAAIFATRVLGHSTWQQLIVGGSNLGELLGALVVFVTANKVYTPIPFIRLDALLLNLVWVLPYYYPPAEKVKYAWRLAALFIPISLGWAAGDVSLAAYIQSTLARVESPNLGVSALGAVMAFLYVVYIVVYAILSAVLGNYVDGYYNEHGDVHGALRNVGGVQFTILCVVMLAATLLPKGALSLNPQLLHGEDLNSDIEHLNVRQRDGTAASLPSHD